MSARPIPFFGHMLRRYRLYAGFSQEELADRARLSARAISDLERGVKQTPHRETVELLADALGLSGQRRALFSASVRPAQKPGGEAALLRRVRGDVVAHLTPPIGRERELLELARLMTNGGARLVTLTGPGGVGKTRVALRAAEELASDFDDGALIVSLSSLVDAGLFLPTVAHGLGLGEEASKASIDQLASHLGQQQLLLILDNMEHLLDAASDVAALLAVCPRLSVIVTSRQPLRIRGEREFGISPLPPDAAAQLFLDRVRDNGSYGDEDADVTEIVAHICHQLDYLPLALELAAVRSRTLPLHALALRLGSSLSLLTLGLRDLPERQRTLRGAIAWSVDLLDKPERRLFRRLATFHGGWSLDAAHLVCSQAPDAPEDTLDRLSSLVERNLVLVNSTAHGEFRFTMLRTIWEYADEALRLTGEAAEVRERHAAYFATLAEDESDVSDLDAHDRLIQLDADNMRAALRWAVETRHAPLGVRLGVGLGRYWYMRGYGHEGERWMRNVLALDESAEPRADPQLRIAALYAATRFAMDRQDYDGAERMAREGLALADEARSATGKANMLATLGHVAEARMNHEEAYGLFERSLQCGRQADDLHVIGRAVSSLGNLARARADYAQARTFLEEAVAVARTMKMSWGIANGLTSLGHVICEQGQFVSASALYRESLGIYADLANEASVAWTLEGVVVVHAAAGAHMQAATLAGVIDTLRCDASGASLAPFSGALQAAQAALGPSLWRNAFAEGAVMDIAAATTYAIASLN